MANTATGHRALDFPELFEQLSNFNPVLAIPVVFLFKTTSTFREDVLQRLLLGKGEPLPEHVERRNLGAVPWYRTSKPSRGVVPRAEGDVPKVTGQCILIDQDLLEEEKCIISQEFEKSEVQQTHECAIVPIADAYHFLCTEPYYQSWFDSGSLDAACRLEPEPAVEAEEVITDTELPVLLPENCTPEKEEHLTGLFEVDWFEASEPDFVRIPISYVDGESTDAATKQDENISNLMQHFLDRGWFPHDFIIIDDMAVSSLPFDEEHFPTFLYGTKLSIWHEAAERQTIAIDSLGYAIGRLKMKNMDDYMMMLGASVKGMGLGHFVGDREDYKHYYWGCWKDENGVVSEDIKPHFMYD
ncbi:hypothetical protein HBI13_024840 [Parastagonospora nodorum]|nr:hypothetical protein HBI10_041390 [Parastagonospora nodorum]KAH4030785.1 hypothetical protein HBI13_024840 [Parastagonospora nodorum]